MATNYIQDGTTAEFTASGAVTSGSVVVIGGLIGIALFDVAATETGVAKMEGVYSLPKTATGALTKGTAIDFDLSAGEFASIGTPATGDLVGCAVVWEDAADGATTVFAKINQSSATVS